MRISENIDKNWICFVNTNHEILFQISDGECIEQIFFSGEKNTAICHYVDPEHIEIDGRIWNRQEFSQEMEKRGIHFAPCGFFGRSAA